MPEWRESRDANEPEGERAPPGFLSGSSVYDDEEGKRQARADADVLSRGAA
jgi:hypothetical protein